MHVRQIFDKGLLEIGEVERHIRQWIKFLENTFQAKLCMC